MEAVLRRPAESLRELRSWWRGLPARERVALVLVAEIAAVVTIWTALDQSLGVGLAVLFTVFWLPRLPPWPWRAGVEVGLVAIFLVAMVFSDSVRSVGPALAVAFAITWIPFVRRLQHVEKVPPFARRRIVPAIAGVGLPAAVLAVAIAFPYYTANMFTIPVFGVWPDVHTGVVMLVFVMMAIGLNIVVGYAGLLDLGYVAFYAMGAYTCAWFASLQFAGAKADGSPKRIIHFGAVGIDPKLGGIHFAIWMLLPLAGNLTALIGVLIGLPTLRLRGDYLAIVTLGLGEIMPQVARNGDKLFGTNFNLTNGPNGITPIDPLGFGHRLSSWTGGFLPNNYLASPDSDRLYFWTAIVLVLFTVFCSWRLRDSRLGRAWVAIREDETAAAAMGVPLMRTKTWAYATGAFFGGIAGAYYAAFKSATFPQDFFLNFSIAILIMVILGGMGNIWGVIFGGAFLAYLDQAGLANTGSWLNTHLHTNIEVPKYEYGIFGLILLITMLFRPAGLIPSSRRKLEFEHGVADEPLFDVQHDAHGAGA
jgi:branched-chain amino acid transport system permease protein